LTEREREVATLIAQGLSNRDIAQTLVVAERTVTTHITSIFTKLGFTSRVQVATWASNRDLATTLDRE
jgi:DNA-binding NarL/FixJ family response regulator